MVHGHLLQLRDVRSPREDSLGLPAERGAGPAAVAWAYWWWSRWLGAKARGLRTENPAEECTLRSHDGTDPGSRRRSPSEKRRRHSVVCPPALGCHVAGHRSPGSLPPHWLLRGRRPGHAGTRVHTFACTPPTVLDAWAWFVARLLCFTTVGGENVADILWPEHRI